MLVSVCPSAYMYDCVSCLDNTEDLLAVYSFADNFDPPSFSDDTFFGLTSARVFELKKGIFSQCLLVDVVDIKHESNFLFSSDRLTISTNRVRSSYIHLSCLFVL